MSPNNELPIVRIMVNYINPAVGKWIKEGRQGDCPEPYWLYEEHDAAVLMWNINKGTMRCRPLMPDGLTRESVNCSDKPLREKYELLPKRRVLGVL